MRRNFINRKYFYLLLGLSALSTPARALTLDWSGYLRANHDYINDYQMNGAAPGYSVDPVANSANGEYIPGAGEKSAAFSSVFMKLKPKVLVNDNVIIHSEWNLGDPVYGFFGQQVPRYDRNNPWSSSKGDMNLSVARLWLDTHTDFGTVQVGRAPMHWGLGAIFNSGDGVYDRFQSTFDIIRLVSKFGYLSFAPFYAKNSMGGHLAGANDPSQEPGSDTTVAGSDDVTDFGISIKYDNPEEDVEGGVLYMRRGASDSQATYFYPGGSASHQVGANGMDLKFIDAYIRKNWNHFELRGEVPFYSGTIGDVNGVGQRNIYKEAALVGEARLNFDTWKHSLKFGTVPGQGAALTGARGNTFHAMYLNRDYKLGMILFNYNLRGLGNVNPDPIYGANGTTVFPTVVSPYDISITNAKYLMWASEKRWEQWAVSFGLVYAQANQTAQAGQDFYNHFQHKWGTAVETQKKNMGWEFDMGTSYNWDENISFGLEGGLFMPGPYFAFWNVTDGYASQVHDRGQTGNTSMVKAISLTGTTNF